MTKNKILETISRIDAQIIAAQGALTQGEIADLSTVNDQVITLCDAIARLPATEAIEVQTAMGALISHLDQYAFALKEFRNGFEG